MVKSQEILDIEQQIHVLQKVERRLRVERSLVHIHNMTKVMFKLINLEQELGQELVKEVKSLPSIDEKLDIIEAALNIG
jgi:hypothetical protein